MADQTERPTPDPEQHVGGPEYRTEQSGKNTLAAKGLNFCYRLRGAFNALYEQYGAWMILAIACAFFTALGYSAGFKTSQEIFADVYAIQQASFDDRIENARKLINQANETIRIQSMQLAAMGVKSGEAATSAANAATSASDTAKSLGDVLKNQKTETPK